MSTGIVICSTCKREVHQNKTWYHCEDRTPICKSGQAVFPQNLSEIRGKYCGRDQAPESRLFSPIVFDSPNHFKGGGKKRDKRAQRRRR